MPLGWAVCESGEAQGHAFFPTTSIVSSLYVTEDGSSAEIAVAGNEGVVGVAVFMGGDSMSSRAVVQNAGECYRIEANLLQQEFGLGGSLQHLALRFTQTLIAQMVQTGACNRHHTLEQQLCRWLLLSLDRLRGNELVMTQKLMANMLGVHRPGLMEATGKLQKDGLIDYGSGRVTVLNRSQLEHRACECYGVVKNEIERLFAYELPAQAASSAS